MGLVCFYRGAWGSPLLCTSQTQTWGFLSFPVPLLSPPPQLTAPWGGVKAPQQPCLRMGNRKAPLPLCLWTPHPTRLPWALSSSGRCEDTGKRPGLGRWPGWAGRKTCFHATPSKVVWKQKEQNMRPYTHGVERKS